MAVFLIYFFLVSGPRTLHRPCGESIGVRLHHAESALVALVAAVAATEIATVSVTEETETATVKRTGIGIVTGMQIAATVRKGIETAEREIAILGTKRGMSIV